MSNLKNNSLEPRVTVIIPSYNHSKFIKIAIESVILQTYRNIELIIIDDGSTDDSILKIRDMDGFCQKRFVNYKFIEKQNSGLNDSLNIGINLASGYYICFLASDDVFLPEKIEKQVDLMENNSSFGMCYGRCRFINEKGENVKLNQLQPEYKGGWIFDEIITLKFHPPVNYLYPKSVLLEMGGFVKGIVTEDFYMNCKISKKYKIGFINEDISEYRVYNKGIVKRDLIKLFDSQKQVIDMFKDCTIYPKACKEEQIRRFLAISGFTKYKKKSFFLFFSICNKFYDIRVLKGIIKIFFFWKDCNFYTT